VVAIEAAETGVNHTVARCRVTIYASYLGRTGNSFVEAHAGSRGTIPVVAGEVAETSEVIDTEALGAVHDCKVQGRTEGAPNRCSVAADPGIVVV
jgi:hypothetical protein